MPFFRVDKSINDMSGFKTANVTSWIHRGLQFIMHVMERKRFLFLLVLLALATQLAFAAIATRPSISIGYGASLCHPTADYLQKYPGNSEVEMPYFRTSGAFSLDLEVLNIAYIFGEQNKQAVQLGLGFSYLNVSRSLAFGSSVLKPYNGLGLLVDFDWRLDHRWDLCFRYRFFSCQFSKSTAHFVAHQFEIAPYYRFADFEAVGFSVGMPVALLWKADSLSLQVSVAISMSLDSLKMRRAK